MAYNDSNNQRRPDDYIDRTRDIGWAPIVLGFAFLVVIGFLLFAAPKSPDQPNTITQRSELPNTAPSAPSLPVPSPPKPQ